VIEEVQAMIQRVGELAILMGLIAALGLSAPATGQQPQVDKFVLADTIQPVTQGELDRAIARANSDGARALLIELDTPGGLLDSTRTMAGAILSSRFRSSSMWLRRGRAPGQRDFSCWSRRTSPPWLPAPTPERPIR
jgi:membrane-bound ClpP family serine protease